MTLNQKVYASLSENRCINLDYECLLIQGQFNRSCNIFIDNPRGFVFLECKKTNFNLLSNKNISSLTVIFH